MNHFASLPRSPISSHNSDLGAQILMPRLKLEFVQTCRGIAALLVVLFHVSQLSREKLGHPFLFDLFRFGDVGVNFFFVLSGFIIFWVHRVDIGRRDRLRQFILKRFIRIYPIYWLIILFILCIYAISPTFGNPGEPSLDAIIKSLLLIPQEQTPLLAVAWSLSYEFIFYFLFSLTIVLQPRLSAALLSIWLLLSGLTALPTVAQNVDLSHSFIIAFIFNIHNLEFALGCLSAYWVSYHPSRRGWIILLSGALLFLLFAVDEPAQSTLDRAILCGIPSALIVLGAASLDISRSHRIPKIFPYLGDASYSIYLVHYLCLSAALKVALAIHLPSYLGSFLTVSLLVVIATISGCLTYSYIEKPLVFSLRRKLVEPSNLHLDNQGNSAMKILFLDQSGKLGGAELWLLDIAKPYRDRALVCLFTDGAFRTRLEQQYIPVQVLSNQPIQVRKDSGWLKGLQSLGQLLPLVMQVAKLSRNYDLIYANTPKALVVGALASILSRRKLVYHLHDILSPDHFSPANRRLAIFLVNRFAALVIATSEAAQQAFIQAGGRPEIATVVYNGFDPQAYHLNAADKHSITTQLRQQLSLEGRFVIGHFSRLSPWKGQHVLLEALARLPGHFVAIFVGDALYGEQDYVHQLQAQVVQLGLQDRVRFLGFRDDVVPLMHTCDLVVHTSTAPEPFGRVVVEAMLCGKPIVAAAAGGIIELVEPGQNGWLVPPQDPQRLAEAIAYCRDYPETTTIVAKAAQTQASQNFHLAKIHHQLDLLLSQIVFPNLGHKRGQENFDFPLLKSD